MHPPRDSKMHFFINGRFLTQPTTGVQRYAREIVDALDRLFDDMPGVTATVLAPRFDTEPPVWRNVKLQRRGRLKGHVWEQCELPLMCGREILFCPGNTSPVISLLGLQRIVVTIHDLSYSYFPEAYSRGFKLWYGGLIPLEMKRAQAILTVSQTERASIVERFPAVASRIHAVANGGWPGDQTPEAANLHRDEQTVLYVGSLSKRKNFPALFQVAIALARKRGVRFRFVGATTAALVASEQTVPADVEHLISFEGQINSTAQLAEHYRRATCFVFPSLYESSGLPPVEAMACGCPVIVSDIPALRERCGEDALYCQPEDVEAMECCIESVLDSLTLQAELRERGYRRARRITWEACARRTLELIMRQ